MGLGVSALRQGDVDQARPLIEEAVERFCAARYPRGLAWASQFLAEVEEVQENQARAAALRRQTIDFYWSHRDPWGALEEVAALAALGAGEHPQTAVRLLSASAAFVETSGFAPENRLHTRDRTKASLQARLDPKAFTAGWTAGHALPIDVVVAEALAFADLLASSSPGGTTAPSSEQALPGGLSAREAEVLRLVAAGLTNAEVAERLFLSPHTIRAHLYRIYAKLDITSRTEAVRFALEHNVT